MAAPRTVWGIDIGQCAVKAVKLNNVDGELQVEAFDIIEHPKILSQPDADRPQLIRVALEQFLARNSVAGSTICIAVPGQTSFTRFVKLPPVETKKIPEIVRFEADQQIPFPIPEVIWRWQTFQDADSPDVEVGIFAMKRENVTEMLDHFTQVDLQVDTVQMAPLALYNFMLFDGQAAEDGATLLVDVGADKTDLVVSDGARIWTRTIQIGGNNFTEALVKAFKLSFSKAERLKRQAATSKYARQIFQAMRPVFADLVQEMQRSVGYYTSLHRETRFKRLVGLGNGFRLPGLQKFLEQNLQIPVTRIDSYNKLSPSPTVNAPTFTENVLSFAVAYGLAVQGLDLAPVETNLLPEEIARKRQWSKKRPWFVAAAVVLLAFLAMPMFRSFSNRSLLAGPAPELREAQAVADSYMDLSNQLRRLQGQGSAERKLIESDISLYGYRNYWPSALAMLSQSVAAVATDQPLLDAYSKAATKEQRGAALAKIKAKARDQRRMIFIEEITVEYLRDVAAASLGMETGTPIESPTGGRKSRTERPTPRPTRQVQRGFKIIVTGRTPMGLKDTMAKLITPLFRRSREVAEAIGVLGIAKSAPVKNLATVGETGKTRTKTRLGPRGGVGFDPRMGTGPRTKTETDKGPAMPDPLLPDEDMTNDTRFVIGWVVTIDGEGVEIPKLDGGASVREVRR